MLTNLFVIPLDHFIKLPELLQLVIEDAFNLKYIISEAFLNGLNRLLETFLNVYIESCENFRVYFLWSVIFQLS